VINNGKRFINMKKIILISTVLLLVCKLCYCQDSSLNRVASFKNFGQQIHYYLKSQHEFIYKCELCTLVEKFTFVVSFKIDVKGNIVEYETNKKEGIPEVVVNYIKKVIYLTSGSWHPEIKDCSIVKSDKILCRVDIFPENYFSYEFKRDHELTIEDLTIDTSLLLNYDEPNWCFLILKY
jgi:hypothetical protein